jgi:hypothetical protein
MFIKMHGDELFLHILKEDKIILDSIPDYFGSCSGSKIRLEDYRVEV